MATFGFSAANTVKAEVLAKPPKMTIAYWHIRGLGAPLRMMALFAGQDADFKTYDVPNDGFKHWFKEDKPGLLEKNAMMNLPYIVDGDLVTQTDACINYLGRMFGLHGTTAQQSAIIEQVLAQTKDMRNDAVKLFYSKPEVFKQNVGDYLANVGKHYAKFAGHFKLTGTTYSCGEEVTSADFHLWEMLDQHELLTKAMGAESNLGGYPRLQKFHTDFASHPKNKAYFASPLSKLRINNTMATFGFSDANTILADAL
jgi:glutathione S-transferase